MQAEPMFKDRKLFTTMADPLLEGNYPVKGLYQALAVAAMCLQEEASTRPLISDVVTALEFLASPEDDLGNLRSDSLIIKAVEEANRQSDQEEYIQDDQQEDEEENKEENRDDYTVEVDSLPEYTL